MSYRECVAEVCVTSACGPCGENERNPCRNLIAANIQRLFEMTTVIRKHRKQSTRRRGREQKQLATQLHSLLSFLSSLFQPHGFGDAILQILHLLPVIRGDVLRVAHHCIDLRSKLLLRVRVLRKIQKHKLHSLSSLEE